MTDATAQAPIQAPIGGERSSAKAHQILLAAGRIFMEQGYGATSMDAVARAAGVSKATLYAHFTNKEQLFGEMIAAGSRRHGEGLTFPDIAARDVRAGLIHFGREFLKIVLSPEGLAIYRVVIAETPRFPELGRAFYEAGPRRTSERLAAYLKEASEHGLLAVADPRIAAWQFLGMIRNELVLRRQLGIESAPPDEVEHTLEAGVDIFLKAYAATPG